MGIKTYYWRGRPNFGDLLTPLLLKRFGNTSTTWSPVTDAELVCVGSVLDVVPTSWAGIIAGSGKLHENARTDFPNATILGVRGPLTARGIRGVPILGDPGLLADELVSVDKEYDLGIVPHWSDRTLEFDPRFAKYSPRIIHAAGDPLEVIREIGRCKKIVASSLHGIIVADAFSIPRRIEMTGDFSREGGDFKFRDHNAAVGVKHTVGLTQSPNRYKVEDLQHGLYDMLMELGRLAGGQA